MSATQSSSPTETYDTLVSSALMAVHSFPEEKLIEQNTDKLIQLWALVKHDICLIEDAIDDIKTICDRKAPKALQLCLARQKSLAESVERALSPWLEQVASCKDAKDLQLEGKPLVKLKDPKTLKEFFDCDCFGFSMEPSDGTLELYHVRPKVSVNDILMMTQNKLAELKATLEWEMDSELDFGAAILENSVSGVLLKVAKARRKGFLSQFESEK